MNNFQHQLTALRRAFHHDPELGFEERHTRARVASILTELGLEVHEGVGVADAHGIEASLTFTTEFIETINADTPTRAVVRSARACGLDTLENRPPMSFSEDFARLSAVVPGCFLLLGNGDRGLHGQPLHSAQYDFNDALLTIGAEFWTALVRDRLPVRS